ncbi:MAG: hypothetical protein P1V36_05760 [Planctomycetota bacterium]|nr:hypothetical protein [Planctomycetota bacterium]
MNGKMTLSFSVATFIAAIGLLFFLSEVRTRLARVERELQAREAPAPEPVAPAASEAPADPLATKDVQKKLDWLIEKLEEVHTQVYEGVIDLESEMYQVRQDLGRVKVRVSRILDGLRASGDFAGFQSSLPEPEKPLSVEQRKEYKAEAQRFGIKVKEGLVIARGLLNGEQDRAYPIEYLMTRYPEAGHETLLHLLGNATLEDWAEPPFPSLSGLVTALYKGLLAAGFTQGKPSHPEREPKEAFEQVPWVLASGDAVYMYVRWKDAEGKTVLARATDWMLDPKTKGVLPEDCFKFTGSMRVEHRETGDELLLSEARGFVVSAYPDTAALIEVALQSVIGGHLAYNWSRLPQHTKGEPFYVDLVFSKTALTEEALADLEGSTGAPSKDADAKREDGK